MAKDWRDYPGRGHSVSELERWAKGLKYFRYCAGHGGHANDGDRFLIKVSFSNKDDLFSIFNKLGVSLQRVPKEDPAPIAILPQFDQPCFQDINEVQTFIWVRENEFTISLSGADGNQYVVTDSDFMNGQKVEEALDFMKDKIIIPPIDDSSCVCEKFYPELWT